MILLSLLAICSTSHDVGKTFDRSCWLSHHVDAASVVSSFFQSNTHFTYDTGGMLCCHQTFQQPVQVPHLQDPILAEVKRGYKPLSVLLQLLQIPVAWFHYTPTHPPTHIQLLTVFSSLVCFTVLGCRLEVSEKFQWNFSSWPVALITVSEHEDKHYTTQVSVLHHL